MPALFAIASALPVRPGRSLSLYVPADMFKKISLYEKEYREIFWQK